MTTSPAYRTDSSQYGPVGPVFDPPPVRNTGTYLVSHVGAVLRGHVYASKKGSKQREARDILETMLEKYE
jgi:hypothetical protein